MRKLFIKIIISIILIITVIVTLIMSNNMNNNEEGTMNIKVYDIDDNIVSDKNINFTKNDMLIDILNDNYSIRTSNGSYGLVLYDIDDIKTDFYNTYIAIYVDNKYSNYGISNIKLHNGIKISFKETKI